MPEMSCPLCGSPGEPFYRSPKNEFLSCPTCQGLFRPPGQLPDKQQERNRYLLHQNHPEDKGYLDFVAPILETVRNRYPTGARGLDFGCGHTPVISEILNRDGYVMDIYDPVFFPDRCFEEKTYDFIVCCEVMEHFHHPAREFDLLSSLLNETGNLICMTSLFSDSIDFESWYYKNDLTHVFLYRVESLEYIASNCDYSGVTSEGKLVIFSK